jgi:isocitrate dehydrogenase (NAD+)
MSHQVVLIPGDGVGPEVVEAARRAVDATGAEIDWDVRQAGQVARSHAGSPLPPDTVAAIRDAGAALKGPTTSGGPGPGPASANNELRRVFDLQLSVRPARSLFGAAGVRPGVDLVLVCMTEEDLYAGAGLEPGSDLARALTQLVLGSGLDPDDAGPSIKFMTRLGAEGVARAGLAWASGARRRRVTVIHQADELPAADGLLVQAAEGLAHEFPGLSVDELSLDVALEELDLRPAELDVLLVPTAHAALLTDLVSSFVGGVGMMPRANLGPEAAVFDTVHGSARAHAGRGTANPIAQILAGVLLLRHLGDGERAERLEASVERTVAAGTTLTGDVAWGASRASTAEVADTIVAGVRESVSPA